VEHNPDTDIKRGYLKENFALFHIKDQKNLEFEFHYHDFNKIVIFISGKVTYLIEGKAYKLKPWDILLVSSSDIHKALIDSDKVYERIVIWINNSFLEKHNEEDCDLMTCFKLATKQKLNLIRMEPEMLKSVKHILWQLEDAYKSSKFGSSILENAFFLQLIVVLNRIALGRDINEPLEDISYEKDIEAVIDFINDNLSSELSIDIIADKLFINKFYLMHKFKKQTGYTIHSYILHKRLSKASSMIKSGTPAYEVFLETGFGDYSSFVRAFKKQFGLPPKKYYKTIEEYNK
jgi:AraC-like DNA-binding protein/quercetin dioxygenase-like cupin family protein